MVCWCEDPQQITLSLILTANTVHVGLNYPSGARDVGQCPYLDCCIRIRYPYALSERLYIPEWHTVGGRGYNRILGYH
jgi:hypothetical protein